MKAIGRVGIMATCAAVGLSSFVCGCRKHEPVETYKRINELSDGCSVYKSDTKFFPGQQTLDWVGRNSGAQVLARAMFTGDGQWPTSYYAAYRAGDLIDANGRRNVISDQYDDPMPILYYPSRIGVSGVAQYVEADNAVHSDPHKGGDFQAFIRDTRFGASDTPHMEDEFLLIAPGDDRKYFTDDDIVNWNR